MTLPRGQKWVVHLWGREGGGGSGGRGGGGAPLPTVCARLPAQFLPQIKGSGGGGGGGRGAGAGGRGAQHVSLGMAATSLITSGHALEPKIGGQNNCSAGLRGAKPPGHPLGDAPTCMTQHDPPPQSADLHEICVLRALVVGPSRKLLGFVFRAGGGGLKMG